MKRSSIVRGQRPAREEPVRVFRLDPKFVVIEIAGCAICFGLLLILTLDNSSPSSWSVLIAFFGLTVWIITWSLLNRVKIYNDGFQKRFKRYAWSQLLGVGILSYPKGHEIVVATVLNDNGSKKVIFFRFLLEANELAELLRSKKKRSRPTSS